MIVRPLPLTSLIVIALAITACGTSPQLTAPSTQTGSEHQLVTLRIGTGVSSQSLTTTLPGSQVLVFDHTTGRAVLSVPTPTARTLSSTHMTSQALGTLDAGVLAVEADADVKVLGDDPEAGVLGLTTWAGGLTTWAGGLTTWAGGAITWAGGLNFLNSLDQGNKTAYNTLLGLPLAQRLIPEQGTGIRVAVIDTGLDLNHPLLKAQIDPVNGWDFVGNDAVPAEENPLGATKYGHGTAVAGIILQVAPKATLLAYRALKPDGSGAISNVAAAISKATANGAAVINLSLGATTDSVALNTSIAAALAKGILVVNSSGNAGKQGVVYPGAGLGSTFAVNSGLFSVGSVTMGLKKSSFSQYARNLSLSAPGELVLTSYPDARLVKASGTSFAAPAVSGALALALSARATSASVIETVKSMAMANQDLTFNAQLGAGTVNVGALANWYR